MFDRHAAHLTDEQLADGSLGGREVQHLESCAECRRRMFEFHSASAAYVEYRDAIRGPMLPPPPDSWQRLRVLVAQHEAAAPPKRSYRWPLLLIAAACAAMAGTLAYRLVERTAPRATHPMSQTSPPAPVQPRDAPSHEIPVVPRPEVENNVGPADMLHVFRALDEIGADVGEPLDVSTDAEHVVVRAGALQAKRRQEIAGALQSLPRVAFVVDAGKGGRVSTQSSTSEQVSANIPDGVRRELEERLGGAIARQEITDRVLELSSSALARAYAVQVLAEKFPPETEGRLTSGDREVLHGLVRRHLSELDRMAAQIRTELKMLSSTSDSLTSGNSEGGMTGWQSGAATLVSAARENDTLLNRLLAGSYSQTEGDAMLASLGAHLGNLEAAVKAEQQGGK